MEVAHAGQTGQSVSTLMDGELSVDEATRTIARLKTDAPSRDCWNAYHLIGDAIRGSSAGVGGAEFCARFSQRLALEPTVLAPRMRLTRKIQTYALSAAASVAAIAVVGWMALSMVTPNTPIGELVQAPSGLGAAPTATAVAASVEAPAASAASQQTAVAPEAVVEQVQEYLLAHQGISPTTAIQGVTPYIRTVSNTGE